MYKTRVFAVYIEGETFYIPSGVLSRMERFLECLSNTESRENINSSIDLAGEKIQHFQQILNYINHSARATWQPDGIFSHSLVDLAHLYSFGERMIQSGFQRQIRRHFDLIKTKSDLTAPQLRDLLLIACSKINKRVPYDNGMRKTIFDLAASHLDTLQLEQDQLRALHQEYPELGIELALRASKSGPVPSRPAPIVASGATTGSSVARGSNSQDYVRTAKKPRLEWLGSFQSDTPRRQFVGGTKAFMAAEWWYYVYITMLVSTTRKFADAWVGVTVQTAAWSNSWTSALSLWLLGM